MYIMSEAFIKIDSEKLASKYDIKQHSDASYE